jgi:hypothetical protein
MSFRKFAAGLLLAFACAWAQSPLPTLTVEPTTGGSFFLIKNTYTEPLTAYLIELVDYPGSYYALWDDMPQDRPIPAHSELRRAISNMTVGAVPDYVKMQAAIYADGTTAGIPEKVAQLVERRRATLAAVREVMARVAKAASPEAARADLKQWSDSMTPPTRANFRSQAAINQAAAKAIIALASSRLATLPLDKMLEEARSVEEAMAASKPALQP